MICKERRIHKQHTEVVYEKDYYATHIQSSEYDSCKLIIYIKFMKIPTIGSLQKLLVANINQNQNLVKSES